MRFAGNMVVAGCLVIGGVAGVGVVTSFAAGPVPTTPGSDLSKDIQAGTSGEHATVNDVETAQEADKDNGEVENVDVQENQTGDQQTGTANDKSEGAGNGASTGADASSGDSASQGAQGPGTPQPKR